MMKQSIKQFIPFNHFQPENKENTYRAATKKSTIFFGMYIFLGALLEQIYTYIYIEDLQDPRCASQVQQLDAEREQLAQKIQLLKVGENWGKLRYLPGNYPPGN